MLAIAGAFSQLFEAEHEDSVYWIFSNFVKKLESLLTAKEDMVRTLKMHRIVFITSILQLQAFEVILEDLDCALLEHIKDLGAHENDVVPLQRYAYSYTTPSIIWTPEMWLPGPCILATSII